MECRGCGRRGEENMTAAMRTKSHTETMGATGHCLYRRLWPSGAGSNLWCALIGSWVMTPSNGSIEIERGGEKNTTINHGCGGGNCGSGGNIDSNSDGETAMAKSLEITMTTVEMAVAAAPERRRGHRKRRRRRR